MASSVWKGTITVSLISIPVRLYAAARSERTYLHQLHNVCHTRLKQPLYCPTCERQVDRKEVVKGYEFEEGQYVLVPDQEIKQLAERSSKTLEVLAFTKLSEIDPIFFDASYFCVPEDAGRKAYQLMVKVLEDTKRVGIGKLVMHQRDYTVFMRPYQHGLTLHTMYFANEIRQLPEYGVTEEVKLNPKEVKLGEQLVESLTEPFRPKQYHNEFQERLKALVEAKRHGKTIEVAPEEKRAPVIDMMAALKKSLAATAGGKKTTAITKAPPARRGAAGQRHPRRKAS
jgi:DNA end-binding protein Ku